MFFWIKKEPLPTNQNSVFKGYHVPFIGYTYTENSLMNDLVNTELMIKNCDDNEDEQIMKLKKENYELVNKLKGNFSTNNILNKKQ